MLPKWLLKYLSKEDRLTIQCANYLRIKNALFHHTFNEGKRSRTMQAKLKAFGVLTGIPDLLLLHARNGFSGMAIELKVIYDNGAKNRLTSSQKEVQKKMISQEWYCVTVMDRDWETISSMK